MDAVPLVYLDGEHALAVIGNLTRLTGFMGIKQKPYLPILTDRWIVLVDGMLPAVKEAFHTASLT